ncbi:unnamed protein product [Mytilus edulis]|uniref:Uncharacterized protein n=1 Tax=Mytilus edulis TaxID=6550 RepID=A0A8S3SYD7_MYTED|nr:unnamed protein product [Mytilus edulis]
MEKKYLKTYRQKTEGMSTERCESLNYYKYLCQNIGSEEVVKIRRLACTILDMGNSNEFKTITSGSKGEGLSLKSSDLDIMLIIPTIKVYESETEVVFDNQIIPLIMNTEETPPCFTQLCLLNSNSMSEQLKDICQTNHLGCASKYLYSSENKQQYCKYKYDLSHLLIGVNSDAVSGWLTLASFFYVHQKYFASLSVINYAMQKYTDEKIFTGSTTSEFTFIQKHALNLMKKEKLYTVIKALTIELLKFDLESSLIPQELPLGLADKLYVYHPLPYAYFLSFLCYYHLHDITSCRQYLLQLILAMTNSSIHFSFPAISTTIMTATAHQLMGDADYAKKLFNIVDMNNIHLANLVPIYVLLFCF